MRTVPLHGRAGAGRVALVDDEDYELVMGYRWYACDRRHTTYARAYVPGSGAANKQMVSMHTLITGYHWTDHRNFNGLDNRRANLRDVTPAQSAANRRGIPGTNSRFKGVTWNKAEHKWQSSLKIGVRQIFVGLFEDEATAARAYDRLARELHGEYAYQNFPDLKEGA